MVAHVSTAACFDLTYGHVLLTTMFCLTSGEHFGRKKKTSAGDLIIEWASPNIATQIKKSTTFLGCIVLWDHCQWLAQTSLDNAPLCSTKKEMIFLNEIRDCVHVEVENWQTAIWKSGGQHNEEKNECASRQEAIRTGRRNGDSSGGRRELQRHGTQIFIISFVCLTSWEPNCWSAGRGNCQKGSMAALLLEGWSRFLPYTKISNVVLYILQKHYGSCEVLLLFPFFYYDIL